MSVPRGANTELNCWIKVRLRYANTRIIKNEDGCFVLQNFDSEGKNPSIDHNWRDTINTKYDKG